MKIQITDAQLRIIVQRAIHGTLETSKIKVTQASLDCSKNKGKNASGSSHRTQGDAKKIKFML